MNRDQRRDPARLSGVVRGWLTSRRSAGLACVTLLLAVAASLPLRSDSSRPPAGEGEASALSGGGFEPAERDSELDAALAAVGDFERGRVAYEPCAVCHGADGRGRADGTFPSIAGQHASVVIKQLVDMRDGNRENHLMLAYAQRLVGPQEIADVAVYVSALPRLSGNGVGEGTQLELGASLYREGCAGCHGGAAGGDAGNRVPVLAGQHYGYMLRQIRDIGAGRRRNAHPAMVALTAQYSDAELRSLVDYVSRLRALASDDSVREARP